MKVNIVSTETVKPSSSTPPHPRTYSLSLLDQLAPSLYVPIVLFYSPADENSSRRSDHLKKSLSETLTHYYPLAGRIKDDYCIDCNDQGATFIEANVAGDMSIILQQPEIDQLQQLLPCNPYKQVSELSRPQLVILATQVNYFDCGGMAIGICIWHIIGDGSTLGSFLKSWAAIACGADDIESVICDCTSIFPPQDISCLSRPIFTEPNCMTKRFLFDGSKVTALKAEIGDGPHLDSPTRFEAVASLIWGAVMAVTGEENEAMKFNTAFIAVDLRTRMNPPLPQQSIGNIFQTTTASNDNMGCDDYNGLAAKLRESIQMMNNDNVRLMHVDGGYFNFCKKGYEAVSRDPYSLRAFAFSSWCKFPFYETDFGWGKPIWLSSAMRLENVAIFLDTRDGKGIEAWVGLPKEWMVKFEQNPGISAYASFSPSI